MVMMVMVMMMINNHVFLLLGKVFNSGQTQPSGKHSPVAVSHLQCKSSVPMIFSFHKEQSETWWGHWTKVTLDVVTCPHLLDYSTQSSHQLFNVPMMDRVNPFSFLYNTVLIQQQGEWEGKKKKTTLQAWYHVSPSLPKRFCSCQVESCIISDWLLELSFLLPLPIDVRNGKLIGDDNRYLGL